jgi:FkbM family methyltransferase
MSIRNRVRLGLVRLDTRLGIREWLRQDKNVGEEHGPSDPFAVSELRHPRPNTVLDIGGSHGQFAREALRAFPGVTIHSFEPIPECFEELRRLAAEHPTLRPIQLALSNHAGMSEFWLSSFRDSSSLNEMLPAHLEAWPHTKIETGITVETARLDDVAPGLNLEGPLFAKIDVQGHEMAVIEGGWKTLSKCERIMLECNFADLYQGQPSFTQLYGVMKDMGLLFDGLISPLRHPRTLEMLSADLIFYKPDSGS